MFFSQEMDVSNLQTRSPALEPFRTAKDEKSEKRQLWVVSCGEGCNTVDGQNPAPPGMVKTHYK